MSDLPGRFIALFILAMAAVPQLRAQERPQFKTGVDLVTVPVIVAARDRNSFIAGLTPADFLVSENGQRQEVTTVTQVRRPLSMCLVVDASGSMSLGNRRQLAGEAAQRILAALQPDDEIAIVFFGETIETSQAWTPVRELAGLDWDRWRPIGDSPLNDGLAVGLSLIDKARNPRRAVVMITDGFENASRMSLGSVVKTRQQSETTVFAVGIGSVEPLEIAADAPQLQQRLGSATSDELRRQEARAPGAPESVRPISPLPRFEYLEALVGDSGGSVSRVVTGPEVMNAVNNVMAELDHEYVVGYTPIVPMDGKYRRLKVEVKRRGVYVRHRGGYLAVPAAQP